MALEKFGQCDRYQLLACVKDRRGCSCSFFVVSCHKAFIRPLLGQASLTVIADRSCLPYRGTTYIYGTTKDGTTVVKDRRWKTTNLNLSHV